MTYCPLLSGRAHGFHLQKRKILWFLARITYYEKKACPLPEAIDFAIDDCLMEDIFYSLFMRRRDEIKELLLQQFPVSFIYYLWYSSSHNPE